MVSTLSSLGGTSRSQMSRLVGRSTETPRMIDLDDQKTLVQY